MKRYYFDTDMRGDPKPIECAEGGLVYFEEANARIAELTAEVAEVRELNRKLGINNDRLRAELLAISFIAGDSNATIEAIKDIARNALNEGV